MSNFYKLTKHPITEKLEMATWIDMGNKYDIKFEDGIFPEKCIQKTK